MIACAVFLLTCAFAWQPPDPASWGGPAQGNEQPACVTRAARVDKERRDMVPDLNLSADAHAWALAITSSGGFIGRGAGNLSIDSDGVVRRWGQLPTVGTGNAQAVALQPLATAIAAARLDAWHACYVRPANPDGCCDLFSYTLTLRRRVADQTDETYQFYWYSDSAERLPLDARAIVDAARKLADDVLGRADLDSSPRVRIQPGSLAACAQLSAGAHPAPPVFSACFSHWGATPECSIITQMAIYRLATSLCHIAYTC